MVTKLFQILNLLTGLDQTAFLNLLGGAGGRKFCLTVVGFLAILLHKRLHIDLTDSEVQSLTFLLIGTVAAFAHVDAKTNNATSTLAAFKASIQPAPPPPGGFTPRNPAVPAIAAVVSIFVILIGLGVSLSLAFISGCDRDEPEVARASVLTPVDREELLIADTVQAEENRADEQINNEIRMHVTMIEVATKSADGKPSSTVAPSVEPSLLIQLEDRRKDLHRQIEARAQLIRDRRSKLPPLVLPAPVPLEFPKSVTRPVLAPSSGQPEMQKPAEKLPVPEASR